MITSAGDTPGRQPDHRNFIAVPAYATVEPTAAIEDVHPKRGDV